MSEHRRYVVIHPGYDKWEVWGPASVTSNVRDRISGRDWLYGTFTVSADAYMFADAKEAEDG